MSIRNLDSCHAFTLQPLPILLFIYFFFSFLFFYFRLSKHHISLSAIVERGKHILLHLKPFVSKLHLVSAYAMHAFVAMLYKMYAFIASSLQLLPSEMA